MKKLLSFIVVIMFLCSCVTTKESYESDPLKRIEKEVMAYNKRCPIKNGNGCSTITSVFFTGLAVEFTLILDKSCQHIAPTLEETFEEAMKEFIQDPGMQYFLSYVSIRFYIRKPNDELLFSYTIPKKEN